MKVFIDTNIPMYAAGKDHPFKNNCLEILEEIIAGNIEAYTDTEVLQEILYRFYHIQKREMGIQLSNYFSTIMTGAALPIQHEDMVLAISLFSKKDYEKLSPRNLIHLAVMFNHKINKIITTDQAFTSVSDIEVIHP